MDEKILVEEIIYNHIQDIPDSIIANFIEKEQDKLYLNMERLKRKYKTYKLDTRVMINCVLNYYFDFSIEPINIKDYYNLNNGVRSKLEQMHRKAQINSKDLEYPVDEVVKNLAYIISNLEFSIKIIEKLFIEKNTIELINSIAPEFFLKIQNVLINDIVNSIYNLRDNSQISGNNNLNIKSLYTYIESSTDIENLLNDLKENSENIRKYRTKKVGHFDLATHMKNENELTISFSELKKISQQIKEIFNRICAHENINMAYFFDLFGEPEINKFVFSLFKIGHYNDLIGSGTINNHDRYLEYSKFKKNGNTSY